MIELKNVYKEYKSSKGNVTKALNNINITFPSKGIIFVLGKSGSGKSTLLNVIGCMDKVTSGNVLINNVDISTLRESKLNNYRNSCFGFIFQDHNLIENFTVYDNLKLPNSLKKNKCSNELYDNYLSLVSLDGLGSRHVNELSGGQKTRVSIARALIKNPNIILADEPTGSLDAGNSIQIFEILKNISKDRLVLVVTHDSQLAYKYADRVISIEDGNIVKDEIINSIIDEEKEVNIVKSKLSLFNSIKFSFSNLKGKFFRLSVVSLVVSIMLTLFAYSYLISNIDTLNTHVSAMVENGETRMFLTKKIPGKNLTTINPALSMNHDEINYIKNNITNNLEESYRLVVDNNFLTIDNTDNYDNVDTSKTSKAYYGYTFGELTFVNKIDDEINDIKLIGNKPVNSHDVVIHKVLADYLITYGVNIIDVDSNGNLVSKSWFAKDYDDLINSNHKIILNYGSYLNSKKYYIVVTGIIDEDISRFDILKSIDRKKAEHEYNNLYKEFNSVYRPIINEMIVSDKFYTETDIDKNVVLEKSLYELIYNYNNENFYPDYDSGLMCSDDAVIYNGKSTNKIQKVNDNEIVLDMAMISYMNGSDKFYSEKLKDYSDMIDATYDKKVKERESKIADELRKLERDPLYVMKEYPEITKMSTKEFMDSFHKKYIEDYGIVGKEISLTIKDRFSDNEKTFNLKVIGYILESESNNSNSLVSENILSTFLRDNKETYKVILNETDGVKIKSILEKYSDSENYRVETIYSDTIKLLDKSVGKLDDLFKKISFGLVLLSIVILSLYILISINNNKKDIGILRSLGTSVYDIYKIYYFEGVIIGFISLIISFVMIYFGIGLINNYISSDLFYNVRPVVFNLFVIVYIVIVLFIVVSASSLIPLIKISKSKVIDIIYDK